MPKSKRRPPHRKEKKARITENPTTPTVAQTGTYAQPRVSPIQPKPATMSGRSSLTGVARHPFVASELKRIGILTGIILVVLIVLAFTLPRFI